MQLTQERAIVHWKCFTHLDVTCVDVCSPADRLHNRKGWMSLLLANAGDSSRLALWSLCTNNHVPPQRLNPQRMSHLICSHVVVSRHKSCTGFLQSRMREALKPSQTIITSHDPNKTQGHKPNPIFLREKDSMII